MKRILFISKDLDGVGIAYKIKKDLGIDVLVVFKDKMEEYTGEGLVDRITLENFTFENVLEIAQKYKPDFIILDMTGLGKIADKLRQAGYIVWGGSELADVLEEDRDLAVKIVKRYGINVPETYEFKTAKEAIEFLKNRGGRWVYKPEGLKDATHTYISCLDNSEDLIFYIEKLNRQDKSRFILQKFVQGIEVSHEIYFHGKNFYFLNFTFEEKKFLTGSLGVNTGCEGDVVGFFTPDKLLFQKGLKKLIPFLKQVNYIGQIDINSIVDLEENDIYFLEFCPRFGYNSIFTTIEILGLDYFLESIYQLAQGKDIKQKIPNQLGCSLRISIPPYPQDKESDVSMIDFDEKDEKHIWLCGVMKQGNYYLTSGGYGCVLVITEKDTILQRAIKRMYFMADKLKIPRKQYRFDIGVRAEKDYKELKKVIYL